jgi:hypothetical protein
VSTQIYRIADTLKTGRLEEILENSSNVSQIQYFGLKSANKTGYQDQKQARRDSTQSITLLGDSNDDDTMSVTLVGENADACADLTVNSTQSVTLLEVDDETQSRTLVSGGKAKDKASYCQKSDH